MPTISAAAPGLLRLFSETVDFGTVSIGSTATRTFTISNVGGSTVTIEKSKPPFGAAFTAATSLPEGTTINPGQTLTESISVCPEQRRVRQRRLADHRRRRLRPAHGAVHR